VEVGLNPVERSTGRKEYMNITIELPPITKKNHSQIIKAKGRLMVIPSKQYRDYEKACATFIPQMPFNMFDCPVNVKCLYYMPTHRRVDLVNLQEATLDILVKYGILKDDNSNIVVSMDGSRVLYDKEHPRTEIEITEV
jgi:Holliday junction resolvase RusA-like endonuclease